MSTLTVSEAAGIGPWDEVWPEVERRLLATLQHRTRCRMTAEDLVQETAAIVLAKAPPMATTDDLYRWARRVAIRLHIDAVRKNSRLSDAAIPDRADGHDVEHAVAQRMRLAAVVVAAEQLSTEERGALLADAPAGAGRREQVRHNVRRHRARARLLELVGTNGLGALGAPLGVLRRLASRLGRAGTTAAAVAVAVPLVMALAPLLRPHADPHLSTRVDQTRFDNHTRPASGAAPMSAERAAATGGAGVATRQLPPAKVTTVRPLGQEVRVKNEPVAPDDPRRHSLTLCSGAGTAPVVGPYDDTCVRVPTFIF
jgi:hypothetical protein